MSEFSQPKKETVRITLPPPPRPRSNGEEGGSSETVRINLPEGAPASGAVAESTPPPRTPPPLRPPVMPPPRPPVAAPQRPPSADQPPADPAGSTGESAPAPAALPPRPRVLPPPPRVQPVLPPAIARNVGASDSVSGPKKETARISMLPEPVPHARSVKMTKTQPLLMVPPEQAPAARVQVATKPAPSTPTNPDAIPMPLIWAAFVISAITLLIQIWNYFAS